MTMERQPLRSFLFAPGNHARRVEKALSLDADAVILDLEDAVATAEKPATREAVAAALGRPRRGWLYVRVNAADTDFCYGDLVAIVKPGLDGVILPKVERPTALATVDWLLCQLERERGLPPGTVDLIPIIETARGLDRLSAILAAGARVRRVAFGAGDFTLDVNMAWSRGEAELAHARATIVTASRAAELEAPLDTVWVDLADREGLEVSARSAMGFGFQGKMCIHPDQIAVVNRVFTPTDAEIAAAERVAAAFANAEAEGSAAIQLDANSSITRSSTGRSGYCSGLPPSVRGRKSDDGKTSRAARWCHCPRSLQLSSRPVWLHAACRSRRQCDQN